MEHTKAHVVPGLVWQLARTNDSDEHLGSKDGSLLLQLCHEGQHVGGQLGTLLMKD